MKIKVKLNLGLSRYSKTNMKLEEIVLEKPVDIQWLIEYFNIQPGVVGVVVVNGNLGNIDTIVYDNDSVEFYPIFGGG